MGGWRRWEEGGGGETGLPVPSGPVIRRRPQATATVGAVVPFSGGLTMHWPMGTIRLLCAGGHSGHSGPARSDCLRSGQDWTEND